MTGGRDRLAGGNDAGTFERELFERGAIYRRIGVEPIVNGGTTFTRIGGSLMPIEVVEAMRQAAECFVDLYELQVAVSRLIATLTLNEAAFVTGGAAAGLFLTAAACITRGTDDGILRPAELGQLPRDFVIHQGHRFPYEGAIELAGGRLVEIGHDGRTSDEELEAVLGRSTAAILLVAGDHLARGTLPLEAVVRIAARRSIPVIVDAAAQLPPPENLWRFTQAGADVCLFSGGKGICGPASTGLVLGRSWLVERIGRNAAPRQLAGRPMKVGKEDLIGILAAVEWFLAQDQAEVASRYESAVAHIQAWGMGREDVAVTREPRGEAGQPTPRARIRLLGRLAASRDACLAELLAGRPRILLEPVNADGMFMAPETLLPGEEQQITARLDQILDALASPAAGRSPAPSTWTAG